VGDLLHRLRRTAVAVAVLAALAGAGTHAPSPISALRAGDWFGAMGPSMRDPWAHLFLPGNTSRPGMPIVVTPVVARSGTGTQQGVASGGGGAVLGWTGIPAQVLEAYRRAAAAIGTEHADCNLTWPLLAAIGRIESGHARAGDLLADGRTRTPIVGPQLDGSGSFAMIGDSDGGVFDNDPTYDRAVGPMQFLPGTWRGYGRDGNADVKKDPHNVYDATLGAGAYLCVGGRDLSNPAQLRAAVFAYNHSDSYVRTVLAWMQIYATGAAAYNPPLPTVDPPLPPGSPSGSPVVALPPGSASPSPTGSAGGGTTSPTSPTPSPSAPSTPSSPGQPPPTAYSGRIAGSVLDDVGTPIPGVRVTLSLSGAADKTTSTDVNGAFSFGALPPGSYTVTEGEAAGYLDKSANEINVQLADGERRDGLKFEEQSAVVMGLVFVDGNDNAIPDAGEQGIPDIEITLVGVDVRGSDFQRTVVTASDGTFEFKGLAAGVYTLIEPTQPPDYDDGRESAPAGDTTTNDEIREFPVDAGVLLGGFSFGELPAATPTSEETSTPTDPGSQTGDTAGTQSETSESTSTSAPTSSDAEPGSTPTP